MKKTRFSVKFLAALLAMMMCVSCFTFFAGAASDIRLSITSSEVEPGGLVKVSVSVSGNNGVASMNVELNYNQTHLVPVSVSNGASLSRAITTNFDDPNFINAGILTALYYGTTDVKSNGEYFVFTFRVKDGVEDVLSAVSVYCESASNQDGQSVGVSSAGGMITVLKSESGNTSDEDDEPVKKADIKLKSGASRIKYMAGYSDGTFRPMQNATRYEVIECFSELFNVDLKSTGDAFKDVDVKHRTMVNLFVAAGVINGYPSDNTFRGNNPIKRGEFCKVIVQLLDLADERAVDQGFNDVKGHWAADFINICAKKGYVTGKGEGRFDPNGYIKRCEVATLINRITGAKDGNSCSYSDVTDTTAWYYGAVAAAAK